ncbi:MAG: lamin tail domain-containing protein [Nanoarchaeota archaeon]|nr:lamin tail domain-containing protein [Nanoarchaeota archaeon]
MKWLLCLVLLSPCAQAVVISELMYNPAGNEFDFEYLELWGTGDIGGWTVEGANLTFPPNTTINGFVVAARTPSDVGEDNDFFDRYGFNASYAFKSSLSNDGETLILRDAKGEIQDIVVYGDWAPENTSLERKELTGYGVGEEAWEDSLPGGTPGRALRNATACDWSLELVADTLAGERLEWQWRATKVEGGAAEIALAHGVNDLSGSPVKSYATLEEEASTRFTSASYAPSLTPGGYFAWANLSVACDENLGNNAVSALLYVPAPTPDPSSSLAITSFPERMVSSGSVVIEVSRGNSSEDTMRAWIELGGNKLTSEARVWFSMFSSGKATLPVTLKECKDGTGTLVVEGFGKRETREIEIDCPSTPAQKEEKSAESLELEPSSPSFSFEIGDVPEEIAIGEPFSVRVTLFNPGKEIAVSVSAYVYRASKRYNEERNVSFVLQAGGGRTLFLPLIVENADEGEYKLKVRLWKEGRKTPDELIANISVLASFIEEIEEPELPTIEKSVPLNSTTPKAAQLFPTGAVTAPPSYDTDKRPGLKTGIVLGAVALAAVGLLFFKVKR